MVSMLHREIVSIRILLSLTLFGSFPYDRIDVRTMSQHNTTFQIPLRNPARIRPGPSKYSDGVITAGLEKKCVSTETRVIHSLIQTDRQTDTASELPRNFTPLPLL